MSLFVCSNCNAVDNTALTNWAVRTAYKLPPLCSECDPKIGRWHGRFPKQQYAEADRGEVMNPPPKRCLFPWCGVEKLCVDCAQRAAATDDPLACPDCKAHMTKIGIDAYRCTRCGETFSATEIKS